MSFLNKTKRPSDFESSRSKLLRIESESSMKKKPLLLLDDLPSHVTHLGGGLLVSVNLFNSKVYVDIRQHDVYNDKCYPTRRGIVMESCDYFALVCDEKPASFDGKSLCSLATNTFGNLDYQFRGKFNISSCSGILTLSQEKRLKFGDLVKNSVSLSSIQWACFIQYQTEISTNIVNVYYSNMCFENIYIDIEMTSPLSRKKDIIEEAVLISGILAENCDIINDLNFSLRSSLSKQLYDKFNFQDGIHGPELGGDDYTGPVSVTEFNSAIMDFNIKDWVEGFFNYSRMKMVFGSMYFLSDFVTSDFLKSINISALISEKRVIICGLDTDTSEE